MVDKYPAGDARNLGRRAQIDLYQAHRWDPWTDHEETLSALSDFVAQGKVRYIGSSTYPAAQIVKAQWVARDRGLHRFVCEQPPYSILARGAEADALPTCQEFGLGVIAWSPLAGGWLSGRWRKGAENLTSARSALVPRRYDLSIPANQDKLEAAEALAQLADEAGTSLIDSDLVEHRLLALADLGAADSEKATLVVGASYLLGEREDEALVLDHLVPAADAA